MNRFLAPLLLALVLLPAIPLGAAAEELHVYTAQVGADGWALVQLPPGAHVVKIEYRVPEDWRGAAARPLLYATLPDPQLWSRLEKLVIVPPSETAKPVAVETPWYSVVAVPGRPGDVVRVLAAGGGGDTEKPLMVIVVPSGDSVAREYAEKIAELHPELRVKILTTEQVYRDYPEAPKPDYICEPGEGNTPSYNLSLALHIVGMERQLLGEGLRFLLLIGGARDVPPIYYCSPILSELVSPKEGVVPSDYYYRDPNYDGAAEVAVGRIPFTDPVSLAGYYSALKKWVEGGEWQSYALVSGGAPFASTLFVGEAAAMEAARQLASMNVTVDAFMLSRGNYQGFRLGGYLGRYGVYYIMAHGSGSSLLDYIPGGLWNYDFQELLYSRDVSGLGNPGLFVLPACRDGFWDTDLVKPPFKPPSLAVALLGKGAAVGYVGFSRVAIEVIDGVSSVSGKTTLSMAGADRLLIEFVKALGTSGTIGEAFSKALTAYNALPASHYRAYMTQGEEEIGTLVARTATLLGDPAAPAPWSSSGTPGSGSGLVVDGAVHVGATVLAPTLARYAGGSLPAVNPGANGTVAVTLPGGCPDEVHVEALQRVVGTTLIGMEKLEASMVEAGSGCRLVIRSGGASPSLVRILAIRNGVPTAYYMILAGAYVDAKQGVLVLRGLDALGVIGDEPLLLKADNVTVATLEGGKPYAVIPLKELANTAGAVDGKIAVAIAPMYDTPGIYGGSLVAEEVAKLAKLFRVNVTLSSPSPLPPLAPAFAAGAESGTDAPSLGPQHHLGLAAAAAAGVLLLAARARRGGRRQEPPGYLF